MPILRSVGSKNPFPNFGTTCGKCDKEFPTPAPVCVALLHGHNSCRRMSSDARNRRWVTSFPLGGGRALGMVGSVGSAGKAMMAIGSSAPGRAMRPSTNSLLSSNLTLSLVCAFICPSNLSLKIGILIVAEALPSSSCLLPAHQRILSLGSYVTDEISFFFPVPPSGNLRWAHNKMGPQRAVRLRLRAVRSRVKSSKHRVRG